MVNDDKLVSLVLQSTWSLEEAAHLVHSINPIANPIALEENSVAPVSRTFYWLKKEFGRNRLYQIAGDDSSPRFSPGTIMRHLEERGHLVSPPVRHIYDAAHGHFGMSNVLPDPKEIYIAAAKLIWLDYPDRPSSKIAKDLVGLPQFFSKNTLQWVPKETIRKWLTGLGPRKKGRPRLNQTSEANKPDIRAIGKKLSEK
ncbi:MAG: hypothetical protein HN725_18300 [Alphaproteobacteria bacterium]|jgi:hypothetical protein|nr:hypothetical protein [Alphaproteobacteria bacterium]MBT4083500.1 hypothetical protein [Alphaproteobacteria bacterium]MBT4546727.1 hypothetical protein [Alphaproteobacteria bacterium]MBT7747245.1 hypothetical protein [Alphaproteobacteria bacterium]